MDDRDRYPPARGDEAELFRLYNDELMRTVLHAVGCSTPQTVEDACSFAWAKFLQIQPDRDKNWRGWLFRTAQREVWVLEGRVRNQRPLDEPGQAERMLAASTADRPDPYETRLAVNEVFEILEHLPARLQRIALLRALGMRHRDISELTGDSPVRVGQLIARANDHIYGVLDERAHQQRELPQRAQRLEELERRPPSWLTERIGRPPSRGRRNISQSATRRAWRRAALALDDFRAAGGLGEAVHDQRDELQPLRDLADTAVADLKRVRRISRGCER